MCVNLSGAKLIPVTKNVVLTPPDYDRDIRHYEFDLGGSGFSYSVGDCLGIYPHNNKEEVLKFLDDYQLHSNTVLSVQDTQVWQLSVGYDVLKNYKSSVS